VEPLGICFQLPDGTPDLLDRSLARIAALGYTHAGIGAALTWDVILAGTVDRERLDPFLEVLQGYRDRLRFYVHGPVVNLFDLAIPEMHERTLEAAVEVMGLVGAEIMVIHPPERHPWPLGAPVHMFDLLARERTVMCRLGDRVADWGGRIAIENMSPDREGYHYAFWPERLVAQVEAIDHPAIGICIDTEHLYRAAAWFGFDFLDAVRQMAPLTMFFHLNESTGRVSTEKDMSYIRPLGVGEMSLPPGLIGEIPFDAMFAEIHYPLDPILFPEIGDGSRYIESLLPRLRRWAERRP
jgi:sugar phosphate isomerase/epimerase